MNENQQYKSESMNHIEESPFIQVDFINDISPYLTHFHKIGGNYNFRCPVCGDSKVNTNKTRGYLLRGHNQVYYFYCHNCHQTLNFFNFLKLFDESLSKKYWSALFKEKLGSSRFHTKKRKKPEHHIINTPLKSLNKYECFSLKSLKDSPKDSYGVLYARYRKIPLTVYDRIFYTDDFKKFIRDTGIFEEKTCNKLKSEPRLVIPHYDLNKNIMSLQGRAITQTPFLKYINLLIDKTKPRIYGLEALDINKSVYIVEGAIDSLFIPNAIAMGGIRVNSVLQSFSEYGLTIPHENIIFILDNQPFNIEVIKAFKQVIAARFKICFWDKNEKAKDVNELIMNEKPIQKLLDNYKTGLAAQMTLNNWAKCSHNT